MPFIHIKSLPFEKHIDVPKVITGIASDFSERTGVEIKHIHTTWEFYQSGYYAKGEEASEFQKECNYPIIVDLLTPDFNELAVIEVMLQCIASSISEKIDFPINNIFINHRQAKSNMVFDDGKIVKW